MFDDSDFLEQFESAFTNFDVVEVTTGDINLKLMSMSEIPMKRMMNFVMAGHEEKMFQMMSLIELCLVDPEDFSKVEELSSGEFTNLVDNWMKSSSNKALTEIDEDEE